MCLTCYSYTASLNIIFYRTASSKEQTDCGVLHNCIFFKIPFRAEFEISVCLCVFPQLFRFHPTVQVYLN